MNDWLKETCAEFEGDKQVAARALRQAYTHGLNEGLAQASDLCRWMAEALDSENDMLSERDQASRRAAVKALNAMKITIKGLRT